MKGGVSAPRFANTPRGWRVKLPRGFRGPRELQVERYMAEPRWVTLHRRDRTQGSDEWWTFSFGRNVPEPAKPRGAPGHRVSSWTHTVSPETRAAVDAGATAERLSAKSRRLRTSRV